MGYRVCVELLLALHNILEGDSLVEVEGILEEEDSLVVVHIPVAVEADTLAEDILDRVSVALQSRIVAALADHHLSHAPHLVAVRVVVLLAAVRVVVLLLVVRMAVPGCSFVSPSRIPGYPC